MNISDEAVEAAAKAYVAAFYGAQEPTGIELAVSRAALEAATPHLLADALAATWDSGFTACTRQWIAQREDPSHPITRTNPYADPRG